MAVTVMYYKINVI